MNDKLDKLMADMDRIGAEWDDNARTGKCEWCEETKRLTFSSTRHSFGREKLWLCDDCWTSDELEM